MIQTTPFRIGLFAAFSLVISGCEQETPRTQQQYSVPVKPLVANPVAPSATLPRAPIPPDLTDKLKNAKADLLKARRELAKITETVTDGAKKSPEYAAALAQYDELNASVKDLKEKGLPVPPEVAMKLMSTKDKANNIISNAISLNETIKDRKNDIKGMTTNIASITDQMANQSHANGGQTHGGGILEISADQLLNSYQNNEIAADGNYRGKYIVVYGTIASVGKDIIGTPYVSLATSGLFGVQCTYAQGYTDALGRLRVGSEVRIYGRCDGKFLNVILSDCGSPP